MTEPRVDFEMVVDHVEGNGNTDVCRLSGVDGYAGLDPFMVEVPPGWWGVGRVCRVTIEPRVQLRSVES